MTGLVFGAPTIRGVGPELVDRQVVIPILNDILKCELSGVVRYTHYSLVITGPNRIPLVAFMQAQASESLLHAQQAGELLTGMGGHPEQGIAPIEETHDHAVDAVLRESIGHEQRAIAHYWNLLRAAEGKSIYLEEYARTQIGAEEFHLIELSKLLRDYALDG